jgi:prepilin-type N-terminal cleavage/methylation domain-containing protein
MLNSLRHSPAADRPSTTAARMEAGFTLIELMVAMFIILIAGGMALRFLGDSFSASNKRANEAQVTNRAHRAMDQFSADLRGAGTSDRSMSKISDLNALRKAVLNPVTVAPKDAQTGLTIDVSDVLFAGPNRIEFLSDVLPDPDNADRTECVRYDAVTEADSPVTIPGVGAAKPGLTRTVYASTAGAAGNRTCAGAVLSTEQIIAGAVVK